VLNVEAGSFARLTACCVVLSFMLLLVRQDLRSHYGAQQTARQSVGCDAADLASASLFSTECKDIPGAIVGDTGSTEMAFGQNGFWYRQHHTGDDTKPGGAAPTLIVRAP
jgi:hypothetical protein